MRGVPRHWASAFGRSRGLPAGCELPLATANWRPGPAARRAQNPALLRVAFGPLRRSPTCGRLLRQHHGSPSSRSSPLRGRRSIGSGNGSTERGPSTRRRSRTGPAAGSSVGLACLAGGTALPQVHSNAEPREAWQATRPVGADAHARERRYCARRSTPGSAGCVGQGPLIGGANAIPPYRSAPRNSACACLGS